ncbi:MAG: hypothetical protein EBU46_17980 [Nitrosomonadaceae bacterium]|nr:hypothetical protein [Nitrosomonadaceae bacterium]
MATKTLEPNVQIVGVDETDTRNLAALADNIAKAVAATKAAEAHEKKLKQELVATAKKFWFKTNFQNVEEVINTFDVVGRSSVLQVDFVNQYYLKPETIAQLKELIGTPGLNRVVEDVHTFTVDLTGTTKQEREDFFEEVRTVARLLLGTDEHVNLTSSKVVRKDFHEKRHSSFIPAVNQHIDKVLPARVQVTV